MKPTLVNTTKTEHKNSMPVPVVINIMLTKQKRKYPTDLHNTQKCTHQNPHNEMKNSHSQVSSNPQFMINNLCQKATKQTYGKK